MQTRGGKILLYGYGNPGRGDDGLGPALIAELERLGTESATLESNYQLSVEDAAEVAAHPTVIFIDADTAGAGPFRFERVIPERTISFSSHSIAPGAVVALAQQLFGKHADAYLLAIRGYEFDEFNESLSYLARENLGEALEFVTRALQERRFDEYLKQYGIDCGCSISADAQ
ncbi:MAG: hydrogenase maturation protease [Deltaproteobacteria bacterium]|nr:hydrogenase maturation protease [Deltaproteobacteria bacterium]